MLIHVNNCVPTQFCFCSVFFCFGTSSAAEYFKLLCDWITNLYEKNVKPENYVFIAFLSAFKNYLMLSLLERRKAHFYNFLLLWVLRRWKISCEFFRNFLEFPRAKHEMREWNNFEEISFFCVLLSLAFCKHSCWAHRVGNLIRRITKNVYFYFYLWNQITKNIFIVQFRKTPNVKVWAKREILIKCLKLLLLAGRDERLWKGKSFGSMKNEVKKNL